jgi:alpha-tubulin suppressor-like RCC1 family protein
MQKRLLISIIVIVLVMGVRYLSTQAGGLWPGSRIPLQISIPLTVPTTSNPVGNGNKGVRSMINPSFEIYSSCGTITGSVGWIYVPMQNIRGWFTSHPLISLNGCGMGGTHRVIEYKPQNAQDGILNVELNADVASMMYQPLCVINGDTFEFTFHHRPTDNSRTDIVEFRLGIPTGLPTGSVANDAYSRQVLQASTTKSSASVTGVSQVQYAGTTAIAPSITTRGWGKFSGTHTLPNSGWKGIRNIGFVAVQGTGPAQGNLLDDITLGIVPIIDMGSSRDRTALEGTSPTAINIRVNGRVTTGTKIALRRKLDNPGPAMSDVDFTLGTPTAGAFGVATVMHTTGSDLWLITIPPGDYDGGIYPANNVGGITVPISFLTDSINEGTEWAQFEIARPTKDGSSPYYDSTYTTITGNWELGDPICDLSEKTDGVVYSITELADTPTPTATRTATNTRTNTPTYTATNTRTNTPTLTSTDTATSTPTYTPTNTPTSTRTPSRTPTNTPTATDTFTPTNTATHTNTPTATFTRTITPSPGPFAQIKTAIGDLFVLGLLQNGTLVTWGINETDINQSAIPATLRTMLFKDIAASVANGYALSEDGNLYTWGENLYGEGTIPLVAQTNVNAIGAGARFAFAILSDHTVVAWGRNEWGQTNVPPTAIDVIAIDGGDRHAVALKSNGTVVAWGDNRLGQARVPAGLIGVIGISAGENHTLALLDTGRIVGWGSNSKGQLNIPANASDIVAVAAGRECSLAIKADGTLITWGDSRYLNFPAEVRYMPIVAIDSDNQNSVVSTRNGQIYVAGTNLRGVMVSRTSTMTPLITETPSLTRVPTESLTPSLTRSQTPTRSVTPSRTLSRTRTPSLTRTRTPSRTKFPTWTHTP